VFSKEVDEVRLLEEYQSLLNLEQNDIG